jgi:hypothetical protein
MSTSLRFVARDCSGGMSRGSTTVVILLAIGNALLGMSLGLFVSAFTQTEVQAIQFMPALVFRSCCSADCSSRATRWPRHWRRFRMRYP